MFPKASLEEFQKHSEKNRMSVLFIKEQGCRYCRMAEEALRENKSSSLKDIPIFETYIETDPNLVSALCLVGVPAFLKYDLNGAQRIQTGFHDISSLLRFINPGSLSLKFPSNDSDILQGPLKTCAPFPAVYEPVDCDFTDELEYVSVHKIPVQVSYWDEKSSLKKCKGLVVDIATTQGGEFLVLDGGEKIRLDRLQEIQIL